MRIFHSGCWINWCAWSTIPRWQELLVYRSIFCYRVVNKSSSSVNSSVRLWSNNLLYRTQSLLMNRTTKEPLLLSQSEATTACQLQHWILHLYTHPSFRHTIYATQPCWTKQVLKNLDWRKTKIILSLQMATCFVPPKFARGSFRKF